MIWGILNGMLVGPNISIAGNRRTRVLRPDLALLDDVVAPTVLNAMRLASAELSKLQIRHVVVGGLAVGANGYPRATKDVDFLVGNEAFVTIAPGMIALTYGVPVRVDGVVVDLRSPASDESHLNAALDASPGSAISAGPLIYLKLRAHRFRDQSDIVELLKAGIDIDECRAYLVANALEYVESFDRHVAKAACEEA